MNQKYEVLSRVFGHESFRSFQEEAVDAILSPKRLSNHNPYRCGEVALLSAAVTSYGWF